jgi:outer membrane lipoprotein-sorting protein
MKSIRIRGILPWLSLLALPTAWAGNWDIDALMRGLAKHEGGRAKFVETKTVAVLDKPVVSSGELNYTPPDRLEKRTFKPKQELMVLDGDTLRLERGKQVFTIRLSEHPEALAFVDSLRGTLSGDKAALEKNYKLILSGTETHWTLDLLPDDQRIAAFVLRITFGGSGNRVESIRYLQADGDSSTMTIEPLDSKAADGK